MLTDIDFLLLGTEIKSVCLTDKKSNPESSELKGSIFQKQIHYL